MTKKIIILGATTLLAIALQELLEGEELVIIDDVKSIVREEQQLLRLQIYTPPWEPEEDVHIFSCFFQWCIQIRLGTVLVAYKQPYISPKRGVLYSNEGTCRTQDTEKWWGNLIWFPFCYSKVY